MPAKPLESAENVPAAYRAASDAFVSVNTGDRALEFRHLPAGAIVPEGATAGSIAHLLAVGLIEKV